MQKKTVNIRELAQMCGVSPTTVSRAISGSAPVREETRRKIEQAIQESGYQISPLSRAKGREESGIIGVLVPEIDHKFFQTVLHEIHSLMERQNRYMVMFPEAGPQALRQIEKLSLDGIILLSEETHSDTIDHLHQLGLSTVICGALSLSKKCPSVHVDDLSAAYDGTNYLLGLGHRKIKFITDSPRSISSGFQRIAGSQKAIEDHGLSFSDNQMFSRGSDYKSGYEGAKALLAKEPDVTAIFAHSDASAIGAMAALADLGLRVPQDISVLGFDDTGLGEQFRPRLTCVAQPIRGIVEKTVELLYKERDLSDARTPASITLPHSITVRESCRAI